MTEIKLISEDPIDLDRIRECDAIFAGISGLDMVDHDPSFLLPATLFILFQMMVGEGFPLATQQRETSLPSRTETSFVLCLSSIVGDTTTFRYAI